MTKPIFNDIEYWYQKSQNLDSILKECHEILDDNRNIITICYEMKAYKELVEGGDFHET
tara:strand:- start:448 stop:624 length:177 start_codon:yes stop_codon:yes gene_type:complete